ILILITVLILFAAVWIGLFLSKRITVPIEALSEATREISAGNLDHRVHVQAQDELGLLVRLFNDMAGQLQATTRELEARRRLMEIILESIPTGVISVDRDLRANKINRAGRAMFSSENANTLEEIFGQDFHTVSELLSASGCHGDRGMRCGNRGGGLQLEASGRRICPVRAAAGSIARSEQNERTGRPDIGAV